MNRSLAILFALPAFLGTACPATADFIFTTLEEYSANGINDSG
jgi:hypothetical protein